MLAVLLSSPSLWLGFTLDDYAQVGLIEGWYDFETPPLNLYSSFLDLPANPWWTSPEAGVSFWRPLSSALVRLDHALFGRQPLPYHLHSLLWLAALVATCGLLFARLPPAIGAPALFLVAAEEAHGFISGVICNRHAQVTAVPALLALYAHLRWRDDGWRPGLPLSLAGFAVALSCGEMTLGVMAFIPAYELLAGPGDRRSRLRALAPVATLAIVYVLFYSAMGFGPHGTRFYLDPLGRPGEYLLALPRHVLALLAGGLTAFPASLWMLPAFRWPLVGLGLAASTVVALALRAAWPRLDDAERRALRWWVPGALAALLPVAAAHPSDRQLLIPAIGFAVLFAALLAAGWRTWRDATAPRFRRVAAGGGTLLILLLHLGLASASRLATQRDLLKLDRALEDVTATLPALAPGATVAAPRSLVIVALDDFLTLAFPPLMYDYAHGAGRLFWHVLSAAPHDHRLTRTGPRTLVVEPIDGRWLASELEGLWWPDDLRPGDTVERGTFRAEITAGDEAGITRVAFHFAHDLDDPSLVFAAWRDGALRPLALPAVGESVVVEREEGLLGLL